MLFFEEFAHLRAGRVGFDVALDFGKFAFDAAVLQGFDAAGGFFLGKFVGGFEENFEKEAAVAIFEDAGDFIGLDSFAGGVGEDEGGEDFFGFESVVKRATGESSGEFATERVCFGEHAD